MNEGRLTQTLEAKDLESPMSGRIVWNQKNGGARVDQVVSVRVWTPGGVRIEERKVGFVAITPTIKLFSAGSDDLFFASIGHDEELRVWNGRVFEDGGQLLRQGQGQGFIFGQDWTKDKIKSD